jgi:hypothetical protein
MIAINFLSEQCRQIEERHRLLHFIVIGQSIFILVVLIGVVIVKQCRVDYRVARVKHLIHHYKKMMVEHTTRQDKTKYN